MRDNQVAKPLNGFQVFVGFHSGSAIRRRNNAYWLLFQPC